MVYIERITMPIDISMDRQCVDDCDNAPKSDDEDWWNQCIDQCMEQSPELAAFARALLDEEIEE